MQEQRNWCLTLWFEGFSIEHPHEWDLSRKSSPLSLSFPLYPRIITLFLSKDMIFRDHQNPSTTTKKKETNRSDLFKPLNENQSEKKHHFDSSKITSSLTYLDNYKRVRSYFSIHTLEPKNRTDNTAVSIREETTSLRTLEALYCRILLQLTK